MTKPDDPSLFDDLIDELSEIPIEHDHGPLPHNPDEPIQPVVVDQEAEQLAFEEFLKRLADADESDSDTAVTVLTRDDFAQEQIDPPDAAQPSEQGDNL